MKSGIPISIIPLRWSKESWGMMNFSINKPVYECPRCVQKTFNNWLTIYMRLALKVSKTKPNCELMDYLKQPGMESFLKRVKKIDIRSQVTKLRSPNHQLLKHVGIMYPRYQGLNDFVLFVLAMLKINSISCLNA